MEYTKPIWQIENELRQAGIRIYREAMTGEQCAERFEQLDKSNPDIHEYISRIQSATGNDRYFTMMDQLSILGVAPPYRFYRGCTKTDSQEYVFNNGNVERHRLRR